MNNSKYMNIRKYIKFRKFRNVNYSVSDTPLNEDVEKMRREFPSTPAIKKEHLELMEKTHPQRREWIVSEKPSVLSVTQKYPRLFDTAEALEDEFNRLHPKAKRLHEFWEVLPTKLLSIARAEKNVEVLDYLLAQETSEESKSLNVLRALLILLPNRKVAKLNQLVECFSHETVEEAIESASKQFTPQGGVIRVGTTYYVVLDKIGFRVPGGLLVDAIDFYVRALHVFNVEYGNLSASSLVFLQMLWHF